MSLKKLTNIGAGSVLMDDLREDVSNVTLPIAPHFVVRASQAGPFSLTTLALDFTQLLSAPKNASNAWIIVPIQQPVSVGQRLGWTVFTGFPIPAMVAVLVVNQKAHFLGRKDNLGAGGLWASSVVLKPHHLS